MSEVADKLTYVIKHKPVMYVITKVWWFLYRVETIYGKAVTQPHLWQTAKIKCDFYNAIHSYGYSRGVQSAIKALMK